MGLSAVEDDSSGYLTTYELADIGERIVMMADRAKAAAKFIATAETTTTIELDGTWFVVTVAAKIDALETARNDALQELADEAQELDLGY